MLWTSVKIFVVISQAVLGSVHVWVTLRGHNLLFVNQCLTIFYFCLCVCVCHLFSQQIIPPGGNTSFDVVFLARVVGNVENTLFINTSHHGVFTYQVQTWIKQFFYSIFVLSQVLLTYPFLSTSVWKVFGVGIPNPYRLRPFIGARVPVNSSFSPLIHIHNPYSEPLQVTWGMRLSDGYICMCLSYLLYAVRLTCHVCVCVAFPCSAPGCWDVLQWWGSTSGASHRATRRHWKIMGEFHVTASCLSFLSYISIWRQKLVTVSWDQVTHADLLPSGNSSVWDKGSDESQLLIERCRQPHGFHQN